MNTLCFVFYFLLLSSVRGASINFNRAGNEQCDFNFKSEKMDTTKGNRFINSDSVTFICCSSSMNQPSISLDLGKREMNCCVERGTAMVSGLRPCAGKMFFTQFEGNGPDSETPPPKGVYNFLAPDANSLCPTSIATKSTATVVDSGGYRLVPIVQVNRCSDRKKSFRVKFMGVDNGSKKYAYSWCCAKDIYSDYTLDPKTLCCGLSGAQSPFFAKGSFIMPDNPPCCRRTISPSFIGEREPCEPYVMNSPSKNSPYRTCPPISGIYNITPHLDEAVPSLGPYSYAFPNKTTSTAGLYTKSRCINVTIENRNSRAHFDFFYSFRNIYDRLNDNRGAKDAYGICCAFENMFAFEVKLIARFCCITATNYSDISDIKLLSCKRSGFSLDAKYFIFPACVRKACHEDRRALNSPDYKPGRVNYTVKMSSGTNLYGSDSFFASKNTKVTGPVPIG